MDTKQVVVHIFGASRVSTATKCAVWGCLVCLCLSVSEFGIVWHRRTRKRMAGGGGQLKRRNITEVCVWTLIELPRASSTLDRECEMDRLLLLLLLLPLLSEPVSTRVNEPLTTHRQQQQVQQTNKYTHTLLFSMQKCTTVRTPEKAD